MRDIFFLKVSKRTEILCNVSSKFHLQTPGGGGNYHICRYGMCHFWGAFFLAENKFWGIIFAKITSSHKFWSVILENNSLGH